MGHVREGAGAGGGLARTLQRRNVLLLLLHVAAGTVKYGRLVAVRGHHTVEDIGGREGGVHGTEEKKKKDRATNKRSVGMTAGSFSQCSWI
jgi:hypothetical protein